MEETQLVMLIILLLQMKTNTFHTLRSKLLAAVLDFIVLYE